MQKIHIYLLFYFFSIIITINCKIYSKDEVLSISMDNCKNDKDCPNSSLGCKNSICDYIFYCRNNECIKEDDPIIYGIPSTYNNTSYNKDNIPEGQLTVDICKNIKNNDDPCSTFICYNNSQCYSNSCNNGTCITNESTIISFCSLNNKQNKIECGKVENEHCIKDNECFYGYCDNGYCSNKLSDNDDKAVGIYIYLFYGLLLLIGIFFAFLIIFLIIHVIKKKVRIIKTKNKF